MFAWNLQQHQYASYTNAWQRLGGVTDWKAPAASLDAEFPTVRRLITGSPSLRGHAGLIAVPGNPGRAGVIERASTLAAIAQSLIAAEHNTSTHCHGLGRLRPCSQTSMSSPEAIASRALDFHLLLLLCYEVQPYYRRKV